MFILYINSPLSFLIQVPADVRLATSQPLTTSHSLCLETQEVSETRMTQETVVSGMHDKMFPVAVFIVFQPPLMNELIRKKGITGALCDYCGNY